MRPKRIPASRAYGAALLPFVLCSSCGGGSSNGVSGTGGASSAGASSAGVSGAGVSGAGASGTGVSGAGTTTGGDGSAEAGTSASGGATTGGGGLAGIAGSADGGGGASAAGAAGSPGTGGMAQSGDPVTALDDRKRAFIGLEFGIWHHFGILTYTGKWAQGNLPINDFNPGSTLNPQQWAQAAKSAGAKFGVLTTRHHDGFALWPSKASNFNVGHTTWYAQYGGQAAPNDKGDVVQQYVNGYRAEGLLPAFYYSIWDATQPISGNLNASQVQYLTTQLTELMSNYGPIPLLIIDGWSWMMGHHAAEGWYLHNLIKSLQPDILIVDHEGMRDPYDEDLVMYEEPRGVFSPAGNTWAAVQGQKINAHGGNDWFWASNITGYLSVSDIVDTHINTLVPRYTNFILNCPPDNRGLLNADIVNVLQQVGTYRQAHPAQAPAPLPAQGIHNTNPYFPVSASASSGTAASAIDGRNDIGSYAVWQSTGALPQWVQVDLGSTKNTGFLGYLPPYEAGSGFNSSSGKCTSEPCALAATTGLITSYEIDTSVDGTTFTKATTGTWPAIGKLQGVSFGPVQARYVRLIALAVNSGNAAATELEVGGPQTLTVTTPTTADWGH
jgi:alpha-L-fucosidase